MKWVVMKIIMLHARMLFERVPVQTVPLYQENFVTAQQSFEVV